MKLNELMLENLLPGNYTHETDHDAAISIAKNGFKKSPDGVFFNREASSYTGGSYGDAIITVSLNIDKLLDLEDDNLSDELLDLADNGDGEEIAKYTKSNGYQAWADELQIAVLDTRCISIKEIKLEFK